MGIKTLEQVEKEYILSVLWIKKGHRTQAAKALGMSIRQLHRKLNDWDIPKSAPGPKKGA